MVYVCLYVYYHVLPNVVLSGDASLIEINPFEFSSGNHTLTITFADEDGNVGSTEYSFVAQTREGK